MTIPPELEKYNLQYAKKPVRRRLVLTSEGGPGVGKCLAPGTTILMFDGSIKNVEHIRTGDALMGPDSLPRYVRTTTSGFDNMWTVTPTKGEPYTVNTPHVLSLKMSGSDSPFTITVEDYLASTGKFKHHAKGWRTGVDFLSSDVELQPYFLGLWLGDGSSKNASITTADPEIEKYLCVLARSLGLEISVGIQGKSNASMCISLNTGHKGSRDNVLLNMLRKLCLINNKHIPNEYLINSRKVRLSLLAGLLDSDGYCNGTGYEFSSKSIELANSVTYLCRSLGYAAYCSTRIKCCTNNGKEGLYCIVQIHGNNLQEIPILIARKKPLTRYCHKDPLKVGIKVTTSGQGEYYGFALDGDGLFMLGDFTVTHNTDLFYRTAPRPALAIQLDMNDEGLRERHEKDPDILFKEIIVPPTIGARTEANRGADMAIYAELRDLYNTSVLKGYFRSILIDEGAALYELVRRAFLVGLGFGESPQQSYTPVNSAMDRFYTLAKQHRVNLYIPHRLKDEREDGFNPDTQKKTSMLTGRKSAAGWKQSLYTSQCHLLLEKDERFNPVACGACGLARKTDKKSTGCTCDKFVKQDPVSKFKATIKKCTARTGIEGMVLVGEEISWQTLGQMVFPASDESDWL